MNAPVPRSARAARALVLAGHLGKTYRAGEVEVQAIKGIDFTIEARSFVAFVGPPGFYENGQVSDKSFELIGEIVDRLALGTAGPSPTRRAAALLRPAQGVVAECRSWRRFVRAAIHRRGYMAVR